MIIDSHQHVWDLTSADYPWLGPELSPINRTIDLAECLPSMSAAVVGGTVLVQAADNAEDTEHLIRTADEHPQVVGIVAWVPLDRPDVAARMLADSGSDRRVVGVRNLLHARPDPAWVVSERVDEGLGVLEAAGKTFDYVTGGPAALVHLPVISSRHPDLPIVIDHLGKPPIGRAAAARAEWLGLLRTAAENPRVFAKVSGLYSSVGDLGQWTVDAVRPFFDDALDVFGPSRLMFGSDWPISLLAGGYERTWSAVTELTAGLDAGERDAILGGAATSFYKLDPDVLSGARAARKGTP